MEALARAFSIHCLKGKCIKTIINLTRLPGRHGVDSAIRERLEWWGKINRMINWANKLEGVRAAGGGGVA